MLFCFMTFCDLKRQRVDIKLPFGYPPKNKHTNKNKKQQPDKRKETAPKSWWWWWWWWVAADFGVCRAVRGRVIPVSRETREPDVVTCQRWPDSYSIISKCRSAWHADGLSNICGVRVNERTVVGRVRGGHREKLQPLSVVLGVCSCGHAYHVIFRSLTHLVNLPTLENECLRRLDHVTVFLLAVRLGKTAPRPSFSSIHGLTTSHVFLVASW